VSDNRPIPAEEWDPALDRLAEKAAANGGKMPVGAFAQVAEEFEFDYQTVYRHWNFVVSEKQRASRVDTATRAREDIRRKQREKANASAWDVLNGGMDRLMELLPIMDAKETAQAVRVAKDYLFADTDNDLIERIDMLVDGAEKRAGEPEAEKPVPGMEDLNDPPEKMPDLPAMERALIDRQASTKH
jgi:hypothetical protein